MQLLITSESDTDDPDLLEVLERQFYYPFGLSMKGTWQSTTSPEERYLYNGKELESGLGLEWLDYGARWYDASIGRWAQIDPLAEKYYGWSVYNYGVDNPVLMVDPDGRAIIVGDQQWVPGAQWEGDEDDYGYQVFAALNSLYETIEAGNVSTREKTGNVILDFVGDEAPDVEIIQSESRNLTSEDGTQILWDPDLEIMVGPSKDGLNVPGVLSATTQLAHEFGHAWLAQFSPLLNAGLEKADAQNADPDLNEHNNWILPNVEAKFARAGGEGVRTKYRSIYPDFESYQKATGTTGYGDYYLNDEE